MVSFLKTFERIQSVALGKQNASELCIIMRKIYLHSHMYIHIYTHAYIQLYMYVC